MTPCDSFLGNTMTCWPCNHLCRGSTDMPAVYCPVQERMQSLELQIEQARREAFRSNFTPSWFVLFRTQKAASIAASTRIYAEDNTRFQVHPAPGPEEVNWQHLWMDYKERNCRTAVTWPLMLLLVLFPITLVTSAASRLEYVFCPDVAPGDPTVSTGHQQSAYQTASQQQRQVTNQTPQHVR